MGLPELLLQTGILALKILILMLWLQSKLSYVQFLVAGMALVLVAFMLDFTTQETPGQPWDRQTNNTRPGASQTHRKVTFIVPD